MEEWVKIFVLDDYEEKSEITVFEEVLRDNAIPYRREIEEYWVGTKMAKYRQRLKLFVPKMHEETAKAYMNKLTDENTVIVEDIDELKNADNEGNAEAMKKYGRVKKVYIVLWTILLCAVTIGVIASLIGVF